MILISDIIDKLPAPKNVSLIIEENQEVNDIINEIINAHRIFKNQYCLIASDFIGKSDFDTVKNIFDFLKNNIRYEIESEEEQKTVSPSVLLREKKGDCKHYASFCAGILDCLGIPFSYRFASYSIWDKMPTHVFVVANLNGKDIWIDPVLSELDQRLPFPISFKDISFVNKRERNMLQRVSGLNDVYSRYYGTEKPNPDRGTLRKPSGFLTFLENAGENILSVLTGNSGNYSGGYCSPCPEQNNTKNDFLIKIAAGLFVGYLLKKKK